MTNENLHIRSGVRAPTLMSRLCVLHVERRALTEILTPRGRGARDHLNVRALDRSALTLIELLVVIAIVAILAAMMLSVLWHARRLSARSVCINNLRQLNLASMAYGGDAGRFPTILEWLYRRPAPNDVRPGQFDLGTGQLFPYVRSRATYLCPSDRPKTESPALAPNPRPDHSYVMNWRMCHARDLSACLAPARTVFFTERPNLTSASLVGGLVAPLEPRSNPSLTGLEFPHGGRKQFAMADGHIESANEARYRTNSYDPRFWYPNESSGRP